MPMKGPRSIARSSVTAAAARVAAAVVAAVVTAVAFAPRTGHAAGPAPAPAPSASAAAPKVVDPTGDVQAPADRTLVVTLPDGVAVTLEPGTHGRWLPRGKLPSETNSWALGYHLVLIEGELDVRMPDGAGGAKGKHAFLVQTKAGTLTDWRGKLHVMVHDDKTTAAIYEGALVVGSNGQGFPVYDGAGILMRKGVNPDKSRGIPAAPVWDSDHGAPSLVVEPQGARGNVGVSWKPVPGAAGYRVAIAHDAAMSGVMEIASTTDTSYAMVERGGGGYWAQVRAVGPEGIVGEWSPARSLRVVHYAVPDGATVARDGTIVLPPRLSVRLADADGLEMAYATSTSTTPGPLYWSPVSGSLRLPDDADVRVVHLRDPGLGQEATLTLARRALRVDIDMTPRDPLPGNSIDVRAVAWDPTRRLDPTQESISLEVTRDLTAVPVSWRQAGNTWTARIPPAPTPGPTVIRVVARDAFGAEIGRGFVEIAGSVQDPR
jgi:hypothetical protein